MDFKKKLKSCFFKSIPYNLSRVRDCEAEALPAAEAAEAEQGPRSAFCKRAAARAAKTGLRNQGCRAQRGGGGNSGELAREARLRGDNKQCGASLSADPAEGPYLS